jgi:hypothetical protein
MFTPGVCSWRSLVRTSKVVVRTDWFGLVGTSKLVVRTDWLGLVGTPAWFCLDVSIAVTPELIHPNSNCCKEIYEPLVACYTLMGIAGPCVFVVKYQFFVYNSEEHHSVVYHSESNHVVTDPAWGLSNR